MYSPGSRGVCSSAPDEGPFQPGVSCHHLQPTGPGSSPEEQTGGGPQLYIFLASFILTVHSKTNSSGEWRGTIQPESMSHNVAEVHHSELHLLSKKVINYVTVMVKTTQ